MICSKKEKELMGDVFDNNDLYEYEIESITDSATGYINKGELKELLTRYASKGWRLKFALTNELGINKSSVGYGGFAAGTNATIDETLLIFERKVRTSSEIRELNRIAEEKEKERIENERKMREKKRKLEEQESDMLVDTINRNMSEEELFMIYSKVTDRKKFIYNLMLKIEKPITIAELRAKFGDKVDLMELGAYIDALANEGKVAKNEDTKKYSVISE